jgi:glycosyltransferase involved in cell wall biosynthesis
VTAGLGADRGAAVVCIPVRGRGDALADTVRSVLAHTDPSVPILVCDVATESARSRGLLEALERDPTTRHLIVYVGPDADDPGRRALGTAVGMSAPADVAILDPGCTVGPGWLEGLRSAAYSDTTVATVSALTPRDLEGWLAGPAARYEHEHRLDHTAATLRSQAAALRPRLRTPRGPCVYVRRSALELVDDLDPAAMLADPGSEAFSRSCVGNGLAHLLAADAIVQAADPDRYPDLSPVDDPGADDGPLAHAVGAARRALHGLSAVIDARILYGPVTGTQVHVLELIAALAGRGELRLSAVVPDDLNDYAGGRLRALEAVSVITYEDASRGSAGQADVVHRPFQLTNAGDLPFLESLAARLILTQEDLISFHDPAYFPSVAAWQAHRSLTRLALARADRVVFSTSYTRADAIAEELVEPDRTRVVHLGTDHPRSGTDHTTARPARMERLGEHVPVMLCLGTDYQHKNRVFALRMLDRLRSAHDWAGVLVLAGPAVALGSSKARERRLIARRPALADRVIDLGPISEGEKRWLFERSALVLYPSVLEGFGLVPFEAGAYGVPCMWAPGISLSDLLPDSAAEIVPWDADQSAERALALMRESQQRERNLGAIRAAAARLSWNATAESLVELYHATCNAPPSPVRAIGPSSGPGLGSLTEDAMRLVGPGGELPAEVHRPLLALATHPRLAAPVYAALKLGYRTSYELRRRRRGRP